jgi:hypothetical protein
MSCVHEKGARGIGGKGGGDAGQKQRAAEFEIQVVQAVEGVETLTPRMGEVFDIDRGGGMVAPDGVLTITAKQVVMGGMSTRWPEAGTRSAKRSPWGSASSGVGDISIR